MKAYYFSTQARKLRHGDNRVIRTGRTHTVKGKIKLCFRGLHASRRVLDALRYAPGPILYEVELSGEIIEDTTKVVASERKYIKCYGDVSDKLMLFARKQALLNIELIKPHCRAEDYKLIVNYLRTGDGSVVAEVRHVFSYILSTNGKALMSEAETYAAKAAYYAHSKWLGGAISCASSAYRNAYRASKSSDYRKVDAMLEEILGIE